MFDWKTYETEFELLSEKPFQWMADEFSKLKIGRASPAFLNNVLVKAYGELMPINQVANMSVPDARTLVIKPYDRSTIKDIAASINAANLGINPQIDADIIRISFPIPTEDERKKLVKKAKEIAEETKVKVRKIRQELADKFKKEPTVVEDDKKYFQTQLDELTKKYNRMIEERFAKDEIEIMKI